MTVGAKRKLVKIWAELEAVHADMKQMIQQQNKVADTLTYCQEQAILIGEWLDKYEPEAASIVRKLEEYCEYLYQLSVAVQEQNTDAAYDFINKLQLSYSQIAEQLNQLSTRIEVVFFPYKASMWDALESVWRAARDDDWCDVYVVPISYCDKNSDGTAKEWHYEGQDFPPEVVITSIDQYVLEDHMPDIAYIHNPYDGFNRVTSVAPEYYSGELKKYVQKLVYIPYYYGGETLSDHQCQLLVQNQADYIVMPGDLAVKRAEKYLSKERLLPLGSPKIDRMLLADGDSQIPEEWSRFAQGKKIVLYNTGLSTILTMGYRSIEKLRAVFTLFKERQDVLLWWRPHPLIKATLASSLPHLVGAYEELEKEYLLERIGIYDQSPDGNLAVASTDAFIGDYSSMIYMYGVTGKPIFYLNNYILRDAKQYGNIARMRDYAKDEDDNIIFFSALQGVLCRLRIAEGELEVLGQYAAYIRSGDEYRVAVDDDCVILSPCGCGDSIKRVDISSGNYEEYKFADSQYGDNYGKPFVIRDRYIICPGAKQEFLICSKNLDVVEIYDNFAEDYLRVNPQRKDIYFAGDPICIGEKIYLLIEGTNQMMVFDAHHLCHRFIKIGTVERSYSNMSYDNGVFWLVAKDGVCIARWIPETGDLTEYRDYPVGFFPYLNAYVHGGSTVFTKPVVMNGSVYVFPGTANMILKLDIATGRMQEYRLDLQYLEGQRCSTVFIESSNYMCVEQYDEKHILAVSSYDSSVLLIDVESDVVKRYECRIPESEKADLDNRFIRGAYLSGGYPPYVFMEDGMDNTLTAFLDYLVNNEDWSPDRQKASFGTYTNNIDGSCGQKVHQCMIEKIHG